VIDTLHEELVTPNAARRFFPRRRKNKRPDLSTMYRWTVKGCHRIVLESVNAGGTRCTSREAVARFIGRLSAAGVDEAGVRGEMPSSRRRHLERVARELDGEGIRGA
jgi:hypothetical protein